MDIDRLLRERQQLLSFMFEAYLAKGKVLKFQFTPVDFIIVRSGQEFRALLDRVDFTRIRLQDVLNQAPQSPEIVIQLYDDSIVLTLAEVLPPKVAPLSATLSGIGDEQLALNCYESLLYLASALSSKDPRLLSIISDIIRPNMNIPLRVHKASLKLFQDTGLPLTDDPVSGLLDFRLRLWNESLHVSSVDPETSRRLFHAVILLQSDDLPVETIQQCNAYLAAPQFPVVDVNQFVESALTGSKMDPFSLCFFSFMKPFFVTVPRVMVDVDYETVINELHNWLLPGEENQFRRDLLFYIGVIVSSFPSAENIATHLEKLCELLLKDTQNNFKLDPLEGVLKFLLSNIEENIVHYQSRDIKNVLYSFLRVYITLSCLLSGVGADPLEMSLSSPLVEKLIQKINTELKSTREQEIDNNGTKDTYSALKNVIALYTKQIQNQVDVADTFSIFTSKQSFYQYAVRPLLKCFSNDVLNLFVSVTPKILDSGFMNTLHELYNSKMTIEDMCSASFSEIHTLFDLNSIAEPYITNWINQLPQNCNQFVKRCIEKDNWSVEDSSLGTSSSVHDIVSYLNSLSDIFFALPFNLINEMGIWKCVSKCLIPFIDAFGNAMTEYVKLITSPETGINLNASILKTFSETSKPKVGQFNDLPETLCLYIRINNITLAKQRLYDLLCIRIKQKLSEKADHVFNDLCDESFKSASANINKCHFRLMDFTACKILHSDLSVDFKYGLYLGSSPVTIVQNGISQSSLQTLIGILRGVLEDFMKHICADVELKQHAGTQHVQQNSVALLMAVIFFAQFIQIYEAIIFTDLQSKRLLLTRDVGTVLDDIKLIERIFGEGLDFDGESIPVAAMRRCTRPIYTIVSTLFPVETADLIKTFEDIDADNRHILSSNRSGTPNSPSLQTVDYSKFTLNEVVHYLHKQETESDGDVSNTKSVVIKHDFAQFAKMAPVSSTASQMDLPAEYQHHKLWSCTNIVHVLARRAGWGHEVFCPITTDIIQSLSNKTDRELRGDALAIKFMKKHFSSSKYSNLMKKLIK